MTKLTAIDLLELPRTPIPAGFHEIHPDLQSVSNNSMNMVMSPILFIVAIAFGALCYKEILAGNLFLILVVVFFAGLALAAVFGQPDNVQYCRYQTWILQNVEPVETEVFGETRALYADPHNEIYYDFTFDDEYKGTLQSAVISKNDKVLDNRGLPKLFDGLCKLKIYRDPQSKLPVVAENAEGYRFWLGAARYVPQKRDSSF